MIACLTFPDDEHPPTCPAKRGNVVPIANPSLIPLYSPELRICSWSALPTFAAVYVPEAPMHKDDTPVPRQDEIGPSRKLAVVQPVSMTQ